MSRVGLLPLMVFSLFAAGQAEAWSCAFPQAVLLEDGESTPTEEEMLRHRSIGLAGLMANRRADVDVVVVGRFSRNVPIAFLHEEQLRGIRAMYSPPTEDVQMPNRIEYTYLGAYRFDGHELDGAALVPFSADIIDARVSISAEYGGIVDTLPTTESDVLGVLRAGNRAGALELTTSPCPSYFQIEPAQLSDLLECYGDGLCQ